MMAYHQVTLPYYFKINFVHFLALSCLAELSERILPIFGHYKPAQSIQRTNDLLGRYTVRHPKIAL